MILDTEFKKNGLFYPVPGKCYPVSVAIKKITFNPSIHPQNFVDFALISA
ncbi:MAG: hypothetical protein GY797_37705 [Deltaproteobacteria bacterium]|nr:hypothetical protein [Deltaproteobacteria bacterium]